MQIWTSGGAAIVSLDEGCLPLEYLDSIGLPNCPATFYRLRKFKNTHGCQENHFLVSEEDSC